MHDEPDDETADEVEITFDPRLKVLEGLGISIDDFEAALIEALEGREETVDQLAAGDAEMPPLEDLMLDIDGKAYKLGDLAEVEIEERDQDADS